MKSVNTEVISEVRNKARIVDIVSELVVLKRAGKDYKGLCPFHNEKSPSFFVNPEKGIFKCFGCNEGGDVFSFVQKTKKIGFIESVKELAQKYGVQLIETAEDQSAYDKRSTMLMLYQQAAEFYHRLLLDDKEGQFARDYLHKRGIDDETIANFKLGFAPVAWDGLLTYLVDANKVSTETLFEAGLVRRKQETNHCYDLFRNRLMIPIQDVQGRVIAFGGRALSPEDTVKYINSPESPIYIKGENLFGLYQAKDHIRQKDAVIVVEGYFDAITPHLYGFKNTVATLGTALTERQGKLLVRFTEGKRVYLCFDSDNAGEQAVNRGMETLNQIAEGIGIEMRVIRVPGGKDPDESLRSSDPAAGPEGFQKCIEHAPMLIDYQLDKAVSSVDLNSHNGRIDASKALVPILANIKNNVARGEYVRQWAMKLGLREEELLSDVTQYRRQQRLGAPEMDRPKAPPIAKNIPKEGGSEAELSLLAIYLISSDDYTRLRDKLKDERMIDPVSQRIKETIEDIGEYANSDEFWQKLQNRLSPDMEATKRLWDLAAKAEEVKQQKTPIHVILIECESRLIKERLARGLTELRTRLRQNPGEQEEAEISQKILAIRQIEEKLIRTPDAELRSLRERLDALLLETRS